MGREGRGGERSGTVYGNFYEPKSVQNEKKNNMVCIAQLSFRHFIFINGRTEPLERL